MLEHRGLAIRHPALFAVLLAVSAPAAAQQGATGETAQSSVGKVGQRQTREDTAPNIAPMARINNRVANRVQSRVRSRIDRSYSPQVNAASPFQIAGEQARSAGRRNRR